MNKHYEVESLKFNLVNETTVTIETMDQYNFYNKIASFNFLYNEGWYYTINNKKVEVKRFSTIMNYLLKINENLWYSTIEADKAKLNAKRIKQAENKAHKAELKESDNNKAMQFIERLQSHKADDKTINMIINKSVEELEIIVNNSFKHASKKVLMTVLNVIVEYKNNLHAEHTCKERPRKLINYKEFYSEQLAQKENTNIEVTGVAEIEEINNTIELDKAIQYFVNSNTFNSYSEAWDYCLNNRINTTYILNSNSKINSEQFQELHYKMNTNISSLSLDELYTLKSHLDMLQYDLDSSTALAKVNSWIKRKESQQKERETEKQHQIELARKAYELLESMKSKGLHVISCEWAWKYEYNNKVYTLLSGGGVTNEKYLEFIQSIYNECFSNDLQVV